MAGYRRFVAYVYEYRKGKKENNCGFIKVEVRDSRCRMEMHLQCPGLTPGAKCRVYGFMRNGGLMEGYLLGQCETAQGRADGIFETDSGNMGGSDISLNRMGGMIIRTENGAFFGTEWDDQKVRPENFKEMELSPAGEEKGEPDREEKVSEAGGPEKAEPGAAQEKEPELESQSVQNMAEAVESGESVIRQEERETAETEAFLPFDDEEISECTRIHPKELMHFLRRDCTLRNNRFLQYGYYNFGHLLLGKKQNGQYILGVPGGYDQQERFMANMFGFPYFKESRQIELPKGRGGYWYRLINAPDPNQGNGAKQDAAKSI